ncbi:MAG TPA: NYN domain-containing protein [Vicinamibacterales bacterium]|jgi:uncharacterized LabA/DUF88 family protein
MDTLTEIPLKIAVFIDFDNIEIGVKTTLNQPFDIAAILEAIKERGEVVTKVAYGDWKRAGDYGRLLSQHAIRMVQRNLTPGGDKNGADINLALDALEMAFTHDHINAFVIVGGDSDFITLVEKLKQYDKKVFVVGGRQFTSLVMQKNCHEFIAYENLVSGRRLAATERPPSLGLVDAGRSGVLPGGPADIAKAIPLVKRGLKVLSDREVSPQLGLLKSTLLQLDSTFSERDYGASTFRDFIEKIAKTGLLTLRHSGRSLLVDLADVTNGASTSQREGANSIGSSPTTAPAETREIPPILDATQAQQGVQHARELFHRASQSPRWPMYVRQLKQYLRGIDEGFDERKLGFSGIVEFLRACQREGVFRLERDRKGVLRVFPGANLTRLPGPVDTVSQPQVGEISIEPVVDDREDQQPGIQGELPVDLAIPSTAHMESDYTSMADVTPEVPEQDQPDATVSIQDLPARPTRARRPRKLPVPGRPPVRRARSAKTSVARKRPEPV